MGRNPHLRLILGFLVIGAMGAALYLAGCEGPQPPEQGPSFYTLRLGHNIKEDSAMHVAAEKFAAAVAERTSGRVRVDIFPDQVLGNDHQMVEMARAGELDILLTPTAKMSSLVPAMQYADLPFLFPSREDAYALLDGEVGDLLLSQLEHYGLRGVTFWENGFKHFTANRAIHGPEDFQGLKIRVMKSQIIVDQFKAFGARPIAIDFHQTYKALQDGVVDGQENPLVAIYSMAFHEQQSHLILSNHAYLCYVLSFSKKSLGALPADIQEILIATARELTAFERLETQAREVKFLEAIAKSGTEIITLSDEEQQRFRRATEHIANSYRSLIGAEILAKTEAYLQAKYNQGPMDELVIGLSADMSRASSGTGLALKRGMEMAVAEINGQGGLLGKKLRIQPMDHGGMAGRARQNINQLRGLPHLLAVVGGSQSSVELAVLDLVAQHEIVYLVPCATASAIVDNGYSPNYVFRMIPPDDKIGPFLVKEAVQASSRVALLLENSDWGRSMEKTMTAALASEGVAPVLVDWLNVGTENLYPQIGRIRQAGAEVVLLVAGAAESSVFITNMAQLGDKMAIIAHSAITGGPVWQEAGDELGDLRFVQDFSFLGPGSAKKKRFVERYKERYNINDLAEIHEPGPIAHAYDLVHILALAVQQSGTAEAGAVRQAMEQIPRYEGLAKTFSPPFSPQRHEALGEGDLFMAVFDEWGAIQPQEQRQSAETGAQQ